MVDNIEKTLLNLANASGFALQMALEKNIESSHGCRFKVTSREHPWRDPRSGEEGFIDLLLQAYRATWIVECKRPRGGTWVFLAPSDRPRDGGNVRCMWVASVGGKSTLGLYDIFHEPKSPESMFCVVRGSGERDQPMLERLARQVVLSTDCLADEEISLLNLKGGAFSGFWVPVIVTTADLQVCRFDPASVSLEDGTIPKGDFESVPMVRFRKSFSTTNQVPISSASLGESREQRERTVLIIRASHLVDILNEVKVTPGVGNDQWPWNEALKRLQDEAKKS